MHRSVPPVLVAQPPRPAAPLRPNAKNVLVVEDDLDLRRMLVKALSGSYNVYEAGDGAEALHVLARIPPPDLVLTDVMMPNIDGFMMARAIKAAPATTRTPIVFLTARDRVDDVVAGINSGARIYITKPFKVAELIARIAKILG